MTTHTQRDAFLSDLTCAMRLAEAPEGLGEFYCKAPQWEQDRANAELWYDTRFFDRFSIDDFPDLSEATRNSVVSLISSFRRSVEDRSSPREASRTLARTHLWSIIERMRPLLEQYWANCAEANRAS